MNMPTPERPGKPLSLVVCFWHAVAVLGGLPVLWLLNLGGSESLAKTVGLLWAIVWMAWPLWWPICLIAGRKRLGATAKALLVPTAMWAVVLGFFAWLLLHLPIL